MKTRLRLTPVWILLALCACASETEPAKTRGIGRYPGRWDESGAPRLVPGKGARRNLALHRMAFQSSSYDYNLTAQLVTDGLIHEGEAPWLEVRVNDEPVPRPEREFLLDGRSSTRLSVGEGGTLQLSFHAMPFAHDRVEVLGTHGSKPLESKEISIEIRAPGDYLFRFPGKKEVQVHTVNFYRDGTLLDALPSLSFHSAWKSATGENEWVSIDLGERATFDRMVFHWQHPPVAGKMQVSEDGLRWKDWADLTGSEIRKKGKGRFVRALLERTEDGGPFELKEWEIFGRGGLRAEARPAPPREGTRQDLTRGNWVLRRASSVPEGGEALSRTGYDDRGWLPATVPGTVLTSYVEAGAVPDPNEAGNQFALSESYFRSDFWYRNTFEAHPDSERQFLHFDGVNWKADIYLNEAFLGRIDGAYREGCFDVTGLLKDGRNALAVKVICNEHFGAVTEQDAFSSGHNGGILGADNPTVHASIGWDWVPTVRGRNAGLIDDVYLTYTGPVTVEDPFVRTVLPLPDTSYAHILTEVTLVNHSDKPVSGQVKGRFGDLSLESPQTLAPGERRTVRLDPARMDRPRLWWPNGYGTPYLYDVRIAFETEGAVSDCQSFRSGVRQMDVRYDTVPPENGCPDRMNLYVNGKRFVAFGGNWGLPEQLLRYRAREYDIAVSNHADAHFTMIRNWVGQIPDRELYEACDRYGILVWQDFWLANPADGPDPYDPARFNATAEETVRRIRNHPSIGLYVGRNEGYPPEEIDTFLSGMVARLHPGLHYLSSSADGPVSGRGPYRALPPEDYFTLFGQDKLHSERGMPNVMNYENLVRAFGSEAAEPVSTAAHPHPMYGLHDYTLGNRPGVSSAQRADLFNQLVEKAFGEPADARQFAEWAQWINYDGYRAIFESRSAHRQGMLLWMSHPAWPSLVWQTYDYYLEPTAGYFGCKKACEPLHIQWNPVSGMVELVSWYSARGTGLTARAEILDLQGKAVWSHSTPVDIGEDQTLPCFPLGQPETPDSVTFIRLRLEDALGETVSENVYWQGREKGCLRALLKVPQTRIEGAVQTTSEGKRFRLRTTLTNRGETPAMMLRLKVEDSATGDLVLPVRYTDNYLFLMPGKSASVTATVRKEDCTGTPRLRLEGFNIRETELDNRQK